MKYLNNLVLCSLFLVVSLRGGDTDAAEKPASPTENSPETVVYSHSGPKYPPILFQTNIEGNGFVEKLKAYAAFSAIENEALGMPIGVRVLKGLRTKADATGFSTLMLSAGTLGLVPIVTNKEFKVRYDVFVQGSSVAHFEYEMTSADVGILWAGPRESTKLKPVEESFLEYSLARFLTELKEHEEVQAYFNEYAYYFGEG